VRIRNFRFSVAGGTGNFFERFGRAEVERPVVPSVVLETKYAADGRSHFRQTCSYDGGTIVANNSTRSRRGYKPAMVEVRIPA